MSKYNEISIDSQSRTKQYRKGVKYRVYFSGEVWEGSTTSKLITDEKILDYIFGRTWSSTRLKRKLDRLIDGYPEAFKEQMKKEEGEDEDLKSYLNKIGRKHSEGIPEMDVIAKHSNESDTIEALYEKPLKKRLEYLSSMKIETWRSFQHKNFVDKTLAEALSLIIKNL